MQFSTQVWMPPLSTPKAKLENKIKLYSVIKVIFKIILIMITVNWKDGLQTSTCRSRCGCRASSTRSPSSPPSCRSGLASPSSKLSTLSSPWQLSQSASWSRYWSSCRARLERTSCPWTRCALSAMSPRRWPGAQTSNHQHHPYRHHHHHHLCHHHLVHIINNNHQWRFVIYIADLCPAVSFLMSIFSSWSKDIS